MILASITWNADPVLFKLGSMSVRWYSALLVLSFYLSYRFMLHIYEREGKSRETIISYGLFILVGLLLGGRLMHCLVYEPEHYLKFPLDIIKPWKGKIGVNAVFTGYRGMSGHGSAIGIVLAIILNAIRTKTSIVWMVDRIAMFGPLIGFFVRIGNFFNSEILGNVSDLPWAVLFARVDPHPRHPVQLYEAIAYLVIFILIYRYYKKNTKKLIPGQLIGLVLTSVYAARFILEFFKAKQADVEASMTLNMGHLLSIPMILIGLFLVFRPLILKKKTLQLNESPNK